MYAKFQTRYVIELTCNAIKSFNTSETPVKIDDENKPSWPVPRKKKGKKGGAN
tara:strand:+ start:64 stop:222 length:159 start_codon:yes stop_codon:yes gene_type:complete